MSKYVSTCCAVLFCSASGTSQGLAVIKNMLRNEFTCMNRRLVNIESNIEKLAARCEKIPIMSSDVAACRRELSEVREVIDNMTAVHSQRQLEIFMHQLVPQQIVITVRIVVSGQNFPFRQTLTGRCYWL